MSNSDDTISPPVAPSRRDLLDRLQAAISTEESGRPSVLLVAGSRGQGKTYLLRSLFSDRARGDRYWRENSLPNSSLTPGQDWGAKALPGFGWLAFEGTNAQQALSSLESELSARAEPFQLAILEARSRSHGALSALHSTVGAVFPEVRDELVDSVVPHLSPTVALAGKLLVVAQKQRARRVRRDAHVKYDPLLHGRRIHEQLRAVCRGLPVVLVVDDIDQADAEQTDALRGLLNHPWPDRSRLTVIATVAAEDTGHAVAMLQEATGCLPDVLSLPDLSVAEGHTLARSLRPTATASQALVLAQGFRIPAALVAATRSATDDLDLVRLAQGAEPHASARQVYERLWSRLSEPSQRAVLAWYALADLGAGANVPASLLRDMWAETLPPDVLRAVPLLRIEEGGFVAPADVALRHVLTERYGQMGRADQDSLRQSALSILARFADSSAAWRDADEASVRFVSEVLPDLVAAHRLPAGEGAIVAASLRALLAEDDEESERHMRRASRWLCDLDGAVPEDLRVLVILVRARVEADRAAASSDSPGEAQALEKGIRDLRQYPRFNERFVLLLDLVHAYQRGGRFTDAVRTARAARRGARHMGQGARRYEVKARLGLVSALNSRGDNASAEQEASALLVDVRRWLPDGSDPLRQAVEAYQPVAAPAAANSMKADSTSIGPGSAVTGSLTEAENRLNELLGKGLREGHPVLLRQHLRVAELLVRGDRLEDARAHLSLARPLETFGGADALRLRELQRLTSG